MAVDCRLLTPTWFNVNDGIPKHLCSLQDVTIDDAINQVIKLGPGTLLAKANIKSAFRLLPVHPVDRQLLQLTWKGFVYLDTCLPFGLRSAPKLFNIAADLLQWCIQQQGVCHVMHYLDDFLMLGPPSSNQCHQSLEAFKQTCQQLGVPLAMEKVEGPSASLTFLGIISIYKEVQTDQACENQSYGFEKIADFVVFPLS